MQVFISYSRNDLPIAYEVGLALTEAGIETWSDQKLQPRDSWQDEITAALDQSTAIIVLVSPNSLESSWVQDEWAAAMAKTRRIIPVLVGGVSFADLPPELSKYGGIDLSSDFNAGVQQIIDGLRTLEDSHEPPVAQAIEEITRVLAGIDQRLEALSSTDSAAQVGTRDIDHELVFVISSFRDDMEPTFEAIRCAAQKVGLRAERVKDVKGDYRITERMLDLIRKAYLVVVDLTHERPNVYFELGYARALGKKIVTIARAGTEVHFDIYDWRFDSYIDSRPLEQILVGRFEHELTTDGRGNSSGTIAE